MKHPCIVVAVHENYSKANISHSSQRLLHWKEKQLKLQLDMSTTHHAPSDIWEHTFSKEKEVPLQYVVIYSMIWTVILFKHETNSLLWFLWNVTMVLTRVVMNVLRDWWGLGTWAAIWKMEVPFHANSILTNAVRIFWTLDKSFLACWYFLKANESTHLFSTQGLQRQLRWHRLLVWHL